METSVTFTRPAPHRFAAVDTGPSQTRTRTLPVTNFATTSGAGSYTLIDGAVYYVPTKKPLVIETQKADRATALAYVAILLCLIGFVFGLAYPRSEAGVLLPIGLTLLFGVAVFSRPRRARN